MDGVGNKEVRRRAGIEREFASRADQRASRWFGHLERMDEYRIARKVLMADVSGWRERGRPTEAKFNGYRESGLGRQGDDSCGCATMRER